MADKQIFSDRVAISFEFLNVEGRELTWPGDGLTDRITDNSWCEDEAFTTDKVFEADEFRQNRRSLALDAALEIFSRFGWKKPLKEDLESTQRQRFGPPRRP
jgi:hypothetical protein